MKPGYSAVVLAAFLLVPFGALLAEETAAKPLDGGVWKQLTPEQKSLFTLGYANGVAVFAKFAPGPCGGCASDCLEDASKKLVPVGTAIPQVVQVVDKIYEDEANRGILVYWAIKLAAQKAKGVSDEEWKASVLEARQGGGGAKTP